ncbi:MAG: HD domain-containing phosphohydrolase [Planctomycetia bacterium]|nr:HD domain-containing phosphohydrolase [Planctomycetia bacterium]
MSTAILCAPAAPTRQVDDESSIRLSEVMASLSCALDITEGQPEGHAARTALIGMRIASEIGMTAVDRGALFYALLLKDLGCSSNSAKMAYLFGADDQRLKRDVKTIDWPKMQQSFRYLVSHALPEAHPWERAMRIVSLVLQGPKGPRQLVETRCERGASIARSLGFPEATAVAIRQLDEHWNGKGHPDGLKREEISLGARIANLAQTVEVFFRERGRDAALQIARDRRKRWFDPELVDAFLGLRDDVPFWMHLATPDPMSAAARLEPRDVARYVSEAELDRIAAAFAQVVDAKSPWTFKHSSGVAKIASGIASTIGFDAEDVRRVHRMGLLHDLGKLGVSSMILDKPGKLTEEEFAALRAHPADSERILERVSCFAAYAPLAGAHHERLDGRGYFRGIRSGDLPLAARLMTVSDIYEALTAARPYRDGMPQEKALAILQKDSGKAVCSLACEGLVAYLKREEVTNRVDDQLRSLDSLLNELSGEHQVPLGPA